MGGWGMGKTQNQGGSMNEGIGFGCALAMVVSYAANKSILWAILHGIFGWFYVIYFAVFK